MNMVEKIARHLCTIQGHNPDAKIVSDHSLRSFQLCPFGAMVMDGVPVVFAWEAYAMFVRETIMQLRDPTETMKQAAIEEAGAPFPEAAEGYWHAMIDEALTSDIPLAEEQESDERAETPIPIWRKNRGLTS